MNKTTIRGRYRAILMLHNKISNENFGRHRDDYQKEHNAEKTVQNHGHHRPLAFDLFHSLNDVSGLLKAIQYGQNIPQQLVHFAGLLLTSGRRLVYSVPS